MANKETLSGEQVEAKIFDYQNAVKGFVSTVETPFPGACNDESLDIVAVLEGVKPAALVGTADINPEILSVLIKRLLSQKVPFTYVEDWENRTGEQMIVAKDQKTLDELYELLTEYFHKPMDEEFHCKLGRLLGYTEEAITMFIEHPDMIQDIVEKKESKTS